MPANEATLVATLSGPLTPEVAANLTGVEWLEVRADLAGDLDPDALRRLFPGKLLYTLRSRAEWGAFDGSAERRKRRLIDAATRYDRVDLEGARDLRPEILDAVPPARRLISWHGPAAEVDALAASFARLAMVEAALYKLVTAAGQPGEDLAPLLLLKRLERRDVVAFAAGAAGAWTRLLAPHLGAPVVYGSAGDVPAAPGQPAIQTLRDDYGLPALPPIAALCGVVGHPIAHSLSPRLHNGAYRELGIPALYLAFDAPAFGDFWLEVVEEGRLDALGLPLRGLSITAPHKAAALAVAGAESPLAGLIGVANTLVLRDGVWEAECTDPEGVVAPLRQRGIDPAGRTAAVIGAGGGGRSAAIGLHRAGAAVTLFNRDPERGAHAAAHLGLPFLPLADLLPGDFDLLVNATPLGRGERGESLPFAVAGLRPGAVVIDLVYRRARQGGGGTVAAGPSPAAQAGGAAATQATWAPAVLATGTAAAALPFDMPTPLLIAAADRGAVVIDGREVLLGQAVGQFRMMTGEDLPQPLARRLLGLAPLAPG